MLMHETCCCAYLHGIEDLVCFCLLDPGVVCTLPNQQRRLDLVCMIERADALIQLLVMLHIPHSVDKLLLHGSPVGRDRLEQGGNMGRSHNIHATARTLAVYLTGYQMALKEAKNEGIMPIATRWKHGQVTMYKLHEHSIPDASAQRSQIAFWTGKGKFR